MTVKCPHCGREMQPGGMLTRDVLCWYQRKLAVRADAVVGKYQLVPGLTRVPNAIAKPIAPRNSRGAFFFS